MTGKHPMPNTPCPIAPAGLHESPRSRPDGTYASALLEPVRPVETGSISPNKANSPRFWAENGDLASEQTQSARPGSAAISDRRFRKAGTGTTRYAESFGFAQHKPGRLPASPRFPREIRSTNLETRNESEMRMTRMTERLPQKRSTVWDLGVWVIRACFGFRHSDFELVFRPCAPNKPNCARFWANNTGWAKKQSQSKPIFTTRAQDVGAGHTEEEKTGERGLEPRLTEPESVVLPLHYSPIATSRRQCTGCGCTFQTENSESASIRPVKRSARGATDRRTTLKTEKIVLR
jgi:hypothetical protein